MYIIRESGGGIFATTDDPLQYYKQQLQAGTMVCLRINSCTSFEYLSFNAGNPVWVTVETLNH